MADPIELLIQGRAHELGPGFAVRRVLPSVKRRMVGPFIFLDHFGPMVVPPGGDGMEVRPHPHIGLATVTYLFDGGIFHRDSLGYAQAIRPGDVNWMTAGSGIAHSERTEPEMKPHRLSHARRPDLGGAAQEPRGDGAVVRACRGGEAAGVAGRRRVAPPDRRQLWRPHGADDALLADLLRRAPSCRRRAKIAVSPEHAERAVYVAEGDVTIGDRQLGVGDLAVLDGRRSRSRCVAGADGAKLMLLGGAPMDGPRHIWWNFVSSSKERIEQAKADWRTAASPRCRAIRSSSRCRTNRLGRADVAGAARVLEAADRLRQQLLRQPEHDVGEQTVKAMVRKNTT